MSLLVGVARFNFVVWLILGLLIDWKTQEATTLLRNQRQFPTTGCAFGGLLVSVCLYQLGLCRSLEARRGRINQYMVFVVTLEL